MRLQMMAYLQDVPPDGGAFTVWKGSHARIWSEQWAAFEQGETHTKSRLGAESDTFFAVVPLCLSQACLGKFSIPGF